MIALLKQCPGAGCGNQAEAGARRQAVVPFRRVTGKGEQGLHIIQQGRCDMDAGGFILGAHQTVRRDDSACFRQHTATVTTFQQRTLGRLVRITEFDAHEETVEL